LALNVSGFAAGAVGYMENCSPFLDLELENGALEASGVPLMPASTCVLAEFTTGWRIMVGPLYAAAMLAVCEPACELFD
jgi:hypothetical protein